MGVNYKNQLERADLQNDIPSSINSIHDLRVLYYQTEEGTLWTQENDLIRDFLLRKTGASGVRSLRDLWVLYLTEQEGVAYRPSLGDMMKEFFSTDSGNPVIPHTQGNLIGFAVPFTYAS